MEYFYINVNSLSVKLKDERYNFISEMYPNIEQLYYKLWFLENIATMKEDIKQEQIYILKQKIKEVLNLCDIPDKILLLKISNKYIEPITKHSFIIDSSKDLLSATSDEVENYFDTYSENKEYIKTIRKFKKRIINDDRRNR